MVSVHDIHASVLASAGEEDYDVNLLELPGDGEKDNVCIQTKLKGEPNGEIYLSFPERKSLRVPLPVAYTLRCTE